MKVGVIIEGSTKHRTVDVLKSLEGTGHDIICLGMQNVPDEPDLSYMETGLMTALVLNLKSVDFVVGGCGTGQGYMNAVLQFPGTACGLIYDPVEAWLYSQVNAGNVISLPLNKGYGGIGGDINVRFILERLWQDEYGAGYPAARREIQIGARKRLQKLSVDAHKSMQEIWDILDPELIGRVLEFPGFLNHIKAAPDGDLKNHILSKL